MPISPEINLYVFRHGQSEMNALSVGGPHVIQGRSNHTPLSELGVTQASSLGQELLKAGIIPDKVYSSPAVRARETCLIALAEMGIKPEITIADELQELDQGQWVGNTREEVYTKDVMAEMQRLGRDFKAPSGESMNETGTRKYDWLKSEFADITTPQTVFVFGHGMVTRCVAGIIHGWTRDEIFSSQTENCSETRFDRIDGIWSLNYLGRELI